jgi:hypothetical protein
MILYEQRLDDMEWKPEQGEHLEAEKDDRQG